MGPIIIKPKAPAENPTKTIFLQSESYFFLFIRNKIIDMPNDSGKAATKYVVGGDNGIEGDPYRPGKDI